MKIVAVTPAKNEARLLPSFLSFLSSFCDHVIIADQQSTDGSQDIYRQFPKVVVIQNKRTSHSNEVRWDLLSKAREIEGDNLIVCLDVDERIPVHTIPQIIEHLRKSGSGTSVSLPWIQLWKKPSQYRVDWPWGNNYKECIFFDDRIVSYEKSIVINDHTSRIPTTAPEKKYRLPQPLIHLQYLYSEEVQLKQAWYRCKEFIQNPQKSRSINLKYESSLDTGRVRLMKTPTEWIGDDTFLPGNIQNIPSTWHLQEILSMFKKHSITFFEPLEIWHIQTLREEFKKKTGRDPRPAHYNGLLRSMYYIAQSLRQYFREQ
jgi:glycosyltransferase involved in cell wall biosynthesis